MPSRTKGQCADGGTEPFQQAAPIHQGNPKSAAALLPKSPPHVVAHIERIERLFHSRMLAVACGSPAPRMCSDPRTKGQLERGWVEFTVHSKNCLR